MAIVTVGITATLLAAADENRGSLTVQHVDADNSAIAVWVCGSNVTVGNGWLLLEPVAQAAWEQFVRPGLVCLLLQLDR